MTTDEFKQKYSSEMEESATKGYMFEFVDEVLLPRLSDLIDEKVTAANAHQTHDLKSYIDDKLADHMSEMFKRWDAKYQKEKQFRERVVDLFKKHNIGSKEDIAFLEGLAQG